MIFCTTKLMVIFHCDDLYYHVSKSNSQQCDESKVGPGGHGVPALPAGEDEGSDGDVGEHDDDVDDDGDRNGVGGHKFFIAGCFINLISFDQQHFKIGFCILMLINTNIDPFSIR